MDADDENRNGNGSSLKEDSSGASPRVRTQSECSITSDDGQSSNNTDKRLNIFRKVLCYSVYDNNYCIINYYCYYYY